MAVVDSAFAALGRLKSGNLSFPLVQELHDFIQPHVIERRYLPKHVGSFQDALPDRIGDFLGEEKKLVGLFRSWWLATEPLAAPPAHP